MLKVPLAKPKPDIGKFLRVIRGEEIPERPPLVELFLDHEIVREISRTCLSRNWTEPSADWESQTAYLKNWIEVYYRMGYDYVRMSGGLDFSGKSRLSKNTAALSTGNRNWAEEGKGPISTWQEFENYPWPNPGKQNLREYEFVAQNLPEGMGLFVCPASGFLEIPLDNLFGYQNLCYLLYDNPKLVSAVFDKVGRIIYEFYERLLGLPNLCGFFQGDDMGYKTGTLIAPDEIRKHVLPWHKKLAALAHQQKLVYLLHTCGNLEQITGDLIDDVKIDGRHSFEDEGNPVVDFKRKYGSRTAVLGGVDVDKLCRLPEDALRTHVRQIIKTCLPGGRFALGSGNTVANYVPISNYLAMVEEGLNFRG
ncbi:MAG: uroporphyrinogen decarboxylase family protein [Candidatus Omnitrophota bacterium]